jgi:hypothetical protein
MIQFVCDNCSAVKQPEEVWIVGEAAELVGAVSARREITIQSTWNRTTTLHPLAVHFCSLQCKDEYMAKLFAPGHSAEQREVITTRATPSEVVVERVIAEPSPMPSKKRRTQGHKRAA